MNEIAQHKIKIYDFPEPLEDEEEAKVLRQLRSRVPFAIVGANSVVEVEGRKVRGRKYPWGIAEGMHPLSSSHLFTLRDISACSVYKLFAFVLCFFSFQPIAQLNKVENLEHCDFIALRNMIIRTHLQDLKDVTNNVHYENYRCRKLAGLGTDGKNSRLSNK